MLTGIIIGGVLVASVFLYFINPQFKAVADSIVAKIKGLFVKKQ